MTRKILGLALALVMIIASSEAQAGKGSAGGGRPSFGGSSRPSFGGSSRPSFGGSSRPSFGGSSIKPSVSKPTFGGGSVKPTPVTGSQPKFGGGSQSKFGGAKGSPTDKPKFGGGSTSPPGKTVSTTPIQGRTPSSVSKRPVAESFDKLSGTEARKIESRRSYEKSASPAPSYKTPTGKEVPIVKGDKTSDYLRGRLDESRWHTRYQRTDVFYGSYSSRPVVI